MDRYLFPEVLAITLFKYNSIDNKIYNIILNEYRYKPHLNTILVKKEDLNKLIYKYFRNEIQKIPLIPTEVLYKDANTVYFLNKIISEMVNLRWFQISFDKNAKFNRINIDEKSGEKHLNFIYKSIRGSYRTFDFFKEKDIPGVNKVLKKVGCIKDLNYSLVKLKSLSDRLEKLKDSDDEIEKIVSIKMVEQFKIWYSDNPEALIITDYLEDI